MRRISTMMILVFGIAMVLYFALPSQAVTAQGKNETAKGRQLYMTYCASCHGADGKGAGPAAVALKTPLPNLTMIAPQNGKFPLQRIQRIISGEDIVAGHGSREMPVWGDYFRRRHDRAIATLNVYALLRYIESIQAQ